MSGDSPGEVLRQRRTGRMSRHIACKEESYHSIHREQFDRFTGIERNQTRLVFLAE